MKTFKGRLIKIDDPNFKEQREFCHEEIRKIEETARMRVRPFIEMLNRINEIEVPKYILIEDEDQKETYPEPLRWP
jgi:hypothetical protein